MFPSLAEKHEARIAAEKGLPHELAGTPAELASVDAMVEEAKRRWAARGMPGQVGFVQIERIGDANSVATVYRAGSDRVTLVGQGVYFAGPTGQVL